MLAPSPVSQLRKVALRKLISIASAVALAAALFGASEPADHLHAFDLQHSKMTVYVGKQGLFAFAGSNHEVSAPIASGSFDDATHAVELTVDAAKMQVLDPKASAGDRAKIESNMIGPEVLDAKKFPVISYRSTKIEAADARDWSVEGNLTLHGQTHAVNVQLRKVDATHFSGSATVRQTEFGITPPKVAGGAVKVKDEVRVEFAIALAR
jgi:polyisoprenoid-binding protein YceI